VKVAQHTASCQIPEPKGLTVPAYTFLDPIFQPISAVWAVDIDGTSIIGNSEDLAVIHNPNATNPVPIGFLPVCNEHVVTAIGPDEMQLNRPEGRLKNQP